MSKTVKFLSLFAGIGGFEESKCCRSVKTIINYIHLIYNCGIITLTNHSEVIVMMIEKMSIKNFRKFEELNVELAPQMNVIAGNNAAGKSTVLEALAVGVGSFFLGIEAIPSPGIKKTDVRYISIKTGSVMDRQPQFPVTIQCEGELNGDKISWLRSLNTESGSTTYGDAGQIKNIAMYMQSNIRHGNGDIILPLISYYGTGRLSEISNRFGGYVDCLSALSNEKLMIKWFKKMTMIQVQEETEIPELTAVRTAIAECYKSGDLISSNVDVRYSLKSDELEIAYIDKNGNKQKQPFHELSDGYKNTLSLVGDIAYRMAVLNPQLLKDVTKKTPGVVLIDEVDQHLHPLWQKNILKCLMQIFPKVQFVVTTHSPSIISSAINSNLILLDNDGCHYYGRGAYGKDVNSVLYEIMGAGYRPDEIESKLREFNDCLDKCDFEKAKNILDELTDLLGEKNTDVVNAKIAYDFETFSGDL